MGSLKQQSEWRGDGLGELFDYGGDYGEMPSMDNHRKGCSVHLSIEKHAAGVQYTAFQIQPSTYLFGEEVLILCLFVLAFFLLNSKVNYTRD